MGRPYKLNVREALRQKTLASIKDAAGELFKSEAYESVTIRKVAARAGVTTGAIFPYFRTKDALWRGVMGTEPPVDGPSVRNAVAVQTALRNVVEAFRDGADLTPSIEAAEQLLNQLGREA